MQNEVSARQPGYNQLRTMVIDGIVWKFVYEGLYKLLEHE